MQERQDQSKMQQSSLNKPSAPISDLTVQTSTCRALTKEITIIREDCAPLAATLFYPATSELKGAVMIAPATGVKRRFYIPFADYLAQHGFAVMTFDNTGIGDSLQGSLKASIARLQDWGQLDMPAILRELMTVFPDTTYHLVGHSAGGQLIGLMDNAHLLTSVFNYASSSGCIANMSWPFRWKARFFMHVYIPVNNLLFGLTRTDWVGMGEALPKHVAQQWATWCRGRGYAETDFAKSIASHQYDTLSCPGRWVNAVDDDIAMSVNVDDMTRVYKNMPIDRIILNPVEYGFKEMGHMNYFRRSYSVLWPLALDWLNRHSVAYTVSTSD